MMVRPAALLFGAISQQQGVQAAAWIVTGLIGVSGLLLVSTSQRRDGADQARTALSTAPLVSTVGAPL